MKVILLVIDTLRADHLGCYGYERNVSPNIDKLAEVGVLFENAFPSDVPTQPSFTSMFTGQRGIKTGIVSHSLEFENLNENVPFLTEILSQHNITTAAVSTLYMMRRWFARGFKYYMNPVAGIRSRLQQVDAEEINTIALPWIREHKTEDFFMFVHYWDPHSIYKPPDNFGRLFYRGDECDPENHSLDKLKGQPVWPFTKRQLDAISKNITDINFVVSQYDGEICYADKHVKQLCDLLEDLKIDDETAIILTSDHGESLGEHNCYFDHFEIYETTIHVPLIIHYPHTIPEGERNNSLIQSTISLAPTILNLFEVPVPNEMEGKDLIKIACGEELGYDEIYVNQGLWTAKRATRIGRWKLIKTLDKSYWETPDIELYNIEEDPQETNDLAEKESEMVDELELRMVRWLREKLGSTIDPLQLIVSHGLPVHAWVKRAAEKAGLMENYEKWRMRVDRGEKIQ